MKRYIGFEMFQAEPMNFSVYYTEKNLGSKEVAQYAEGYKIVYPDGYESWSPKEAFEKLYMQVGDNFTIVDTNVNDFVTDIEYQQWGDKTTIANATLANGFILTESSSCVDPANFNMDIGQGICKEKIYNEVWKLLGFLLQTARYGIKK